MFKRAKFTLTRKSKVTIKAVGGGEDLLLWLSKKNKADKQLALDDDGSDGSKITRKGRRALGPGTYWLRLISSGGAIDAYDLIVNAKPL